MSGAAAFAARPSGSAGRLMRARWSRCSTAITTSPAAADRRTPVPERCRAKWTPVRVKKTRQHKNLDELTSAARSCCSAYRTTSVCNGAIVAATQENREDAMSHTMVPSDRVENVVVYGRDGVKLGIIERLMLDKLSGRVAYAVVKTGGMLGSHHHYPVEWTALKYDPARQAFATALTLAELSTGPCEFDGEAFDWGDRSRSYT